jgi:hypothetical protein
MRGKLAPQPRRGRFCLPQRRNSNARGARSRRGRSLGRAINHLVRPTWRCKR